MRVFSLSFLVFAAALTFFGLELRHARLSDLGTHSRSAAMRPIEAFNAIQLELSQGSIAGVAGEAEVIAKFFHTTNPQIAEKARELAEASELADAQFRFRELARLFGMNIPGADDPEKFSL